MWDVSDLRTCRCTVYARHSTQNGTHAIEIVVLSGAVVDADACGIGSTVIGKRSSRTRKKRSRCCAGPANLRVTAIPVSLSQPSVCSSRLGSTATVAIASIDGNRMLDGSWRSTFRLFSRRGTTPLSFVAGSTRINRASAVAQNPFSRVVCFRWARAHAEELLLRLGG